MSQQVGIDLSFGPDTVEPSQYEPLDEGIYDLFCSGVEVKTTQAGEQMIVLEWTVMSGARQNSKIMNDNLVIPGPARKQNEPDKWNMMMNMLRDRLEVITGREWREDNMKLNPQELGGMVIKAIVVQKPYDYVKDGERKTGIGNAIQKHLPKDSTQTFTPSATPAFTPPAANGQPETSSQSPQQGGGFAL